MIGIFKKRKNSLYRLGNTNDRIPLFNSYKIYKDKCLFVLNESLEWNVKKLPNNTLKLQLKNVDEKVNKVIGIENYQKKVEMLADILIDIGGVARFDEEKAVNMFNSFAIF